MAKSRALQAGALFLFIGLVLLGVKNRAVKFSRLQEKNSGELNLSKSILSKFEIAQALQESSSFYRFPKEIEIDLKGNDPTSPNQKTRAHVSYSFDAKLQKTMEDLFATYRPDYGAFVAMDAKTGKVLSLVSYSTHPGVQENLALRASFPSASVFKVVTATAAIEGHKISSETVIPFNGRNHTLYRGQILESKITRWTRFITLKEAFARSINTVFGKIGAFTVGRDSLRQYADRFGFNRKIASDVSIQEGRAWIPDDAWGLAESASGFTRDNTMSPLQGALIAASVANDGVMMEPYVVESVVKSNGEPLYQVEHKVANITMDPATAAQVRSLMKETVLHGTSRGAFRGFFKQGLPFLDVGGKTGSLTGNDPQGKYDWFVGYADSGEHRFAVAALTIHAKQWKVKSSYLARRAMESFFKQGLHLKAVARE